MRKRQQKDIIEVISTIKEAHEQIKKYLEHSKLDIANSLLCSCQESMVSVGENIEKLEQEGHITVTYIEEYCEVLYQVFQELSTQTHINENKIYKNLNKAIMKVENSVNNDIRVRKEVVFFPYKASMWDSLESVYLAAKEDPDCDAYCVPIPYYDMNPDRTFGQMHYEGLEYPKNIEVIDYRTYNLEERQPDVIYIHNPYDNCNFVTSVHPNYYSSNLKKYTEKLVYIPYFILQEIEPDDQTSIDGMKHFVWLPGVINADTVVLQSEKMKQIYVNEYLKEAIACGASGKHIDREYLNRKFLGTGSPKVEKVLRTKKEDLDIPEEWLKIIQKPDGSWKKIVFYNTGISALLYFGEKWIEKIEEVISFFEEASEDVVLLWRPHPLIENTMKSMKQNILDSYIQIKNRFKDSKNGIFDDTSEVDRAIVLSDFYYGDQSSIVWLFEQCRKKILIQDPMISMQGKKTIAASQSIARVNDEYYYVSLWNSGLYYINFDTHEKKYICDVQKKQGNYDIEPVTNICVVNDDLILIPGRLDNIVYFDTITQKINNISFLEEDEQTFSPVGRGWFNSAIVSGSKVYMIPYRYHSIVCLDCENKNIEKIPIVSKERENYAEGICSYGGVLVDNKIYIPSEMHRCVYEIDLQTKSVEKLLDDKRYSSVLCVERKLWMIPFDATETIDVFDIDSKKNVISIELPNEIQEHGKKIKDINKRNFQRSVIKEDDIYLLACSAKYSIIINTQKYKIEKWNLPEVKKDINLNGDEIWSALIDYDNEICVVNGYTGEWFVKRENEWKPLDVELKLLQPPNVVKRMNSHECPGCVEGMDIRDVWRTRTNTVSENYYRINE